MWKVSNFLPRSARVPSSPESEGLLRNAAPSRTDSPNDAPTRTPIAVQLPFDIITCIADGLDRLEQVALARTLCRVCVAWLPHGRYLLYARAISLTHPLSIILFLETLHLNPELGTIVNGLHLNGTCRWGTPDLPFSRSEAKEAFAWPGAPELPRLLLQMCPSLDLLSIDVDENLPTDGVALGLAATSESESPEKLVHRHLKTLRVSRRASSLVDAILRGEIELLSLEELHIGRVDVSTVDAACQWPHLTGLQRLRISLLPQLPREKECMESGKRVLRLLSSNTGSIKELILVHCDRAVMSWPSFTALRRLELSSTSSELAPEFRDFLLSVAPQLEELLLTHFYYLIEEPSDWFSNKLASRLSRLQYLSILGTGFYARQIYASIAIEELAVFLSSPVITSTLQRLDVRHHLLTGSITAALTRMKRLSDIRVADYNLDADSTRLGWGDTVWNVLPRSLSELHVEVGSLASPRELFVPLFDGAYALGERYPRLSVLHVRCHSAVAHIWEKEWVDRRRGELGLSLVLRAI